MKRTITRFLGTILIIINFYSCREGIKNEIKKKLLPSFNVNIPDIQLSVPPIAFVSGKEIPVGALKTPINLDSTIRANTAGTLGSAAITSVTVKRIEIKLKNASKANNLANFESARMRIYSNNDTAAADIAIINFPDGYSDSLAITPANRPEISNYLKGSQLGYNLFWKNRRATTKFLKLVVTVTLSVQ
jgi:hypothetical protein